ncbi:MAG TPA: hypothetical protein ENG83_15265 [Nitrospirae bacterium]|nr:hypothetical protein BMS3Abin06_00910 [bacterium BMS3Abin06]HDH13528.1 hypothetical protein [Nitrospirota bacterium]HDZ01032.1 hypothetical protein [Nitrospirota bacterium]
MVNDIDKELSKKYCPRFGMISVEKGFITVEQAKEALAEQLDDNLANKPHRLIGRIFLEKGWMTPKQIETVLNELFKQERPGEEIS